MDELRPSPELKFELREGIQLRYSEYLEGYPPEIRLFGDLANADPVTLDGNPATLSDDGQVDGPGLGDRGQHLLSCGALTCTYTIVPPIDLWPVWSAHSFESADGTIHGGPICGALLATGNANDSREPLDTGDNPCVLGAQPGDMAHRVVRHDLRLAVWTVPPPFDVVWSVPGSPLHADKERARIRLIGPARPPQVPDSCTIPSTQSADVERWCDTILNCARKGLYLEPNDNRTRALWREYRDAARRLRKRLH